MRVATAWFAYMSVMGANAAATSRGTELFRLDDSFANLELFICSKGHAVSVMSKAYCAVGSAADSSTFCCAWFAASSAGCSGWSSFVLFPSLALSSCFI